MLRGPCPECFCSSNDTDLLSRLLAIEVGVERNFEVFVELIKRVGVLGTAKCGGVLNVAGCSSLGAIGFGVLSFI